MIPPATLYWPGSSHVQKSMQNAAKLTKRKTPTCLSSSHKNGEDPETISTIGSSEEDTSSHSQTMYIIWDSRGHNEVRAIEV
jgi:hypothetical protein